MPVWIVQMPAAGGDALLVEGPNPVPILRSHHEDCCGNQDTPTFVARMIAA